MTDIAKPSAIVSSLGRTGTRFFATLMADLLPDGSAIHEPDILQFSFGKGKGFRFLLGQIRESGFFNLLVRKTVSDWCMVEVSDARFEGLLGPEEALLRLKRQRKRFVETRPGKSYFESSSGFYGLLDLLPRAFRTCRCVFIVRDGRDWIRSNMNWGEMYGKGPLRRPFAHLWPGADRLPDDPLSDQWPRMSRFERLCWAWDRLNRFSLRLAKDVAEVRVYRFEDLFMQGGDGKMAELIGFLAQALPSLEPSSLGRLKERLPGRIHASAGGFPGYEEWQRSQREFFGDTCGELMERMGYVGG
jgi:hypothetical protein